MFLALLWVQDKNLCKSLHKFQGLGVIHSLSPPSFQKPSLFLLDFPLLLSLSDSTVGSGCPVFMQLLSIAVSCFPSKSPRCTCSFSSVISSSPPPLWCHCLRVWDWLVLPFYVEIPLSRHHRRLRYHSLILPNPKVVDATRASSLLFVRTNPEDKAMPYWVV